MTDTTFTRRRVIAGGAAVLAGAAGVTTLGSRRASAAVTVTFEDATLDLTYEEAVEEVRVDCTAEGSYEIPSGDAARAALTTRLTHAGSPAVEMEQTHETTEISPTADELSADHTFALVADSALSAADFEPPQGQVERTREFEAAVGLTVADDTGTVIVEEVGRDTGAVTIRFPGRDGSGEQCQTEACGEPEGSVTAQAAFDIDLA